MRTQHRRRKKHARVTSKQGKEDEKVSVERGGGAGRGREGFLCSQGKQGGAWTRKEEVGVGLDDGSAVFVDKEDGPTFAWEISRGIGFEIERTKKKETAVIESVSPGDHCCRNWEGQRAQGIYFR